MSPGSSRFRRRPAKKHALLGLGAVALGLTSAEGRLLTQNNVENNVDTTNPEEKVELIQTKTADTVKTSSNSIFAKKSNKKKKVSFFETKAEAGAGSESKIQSWSMLGVIHKTEYWGTIRLGAPGQEQEFTVIFDTGSGNLILPGKKCESSACKQHRRYDIEKSQNAMAVGKAGKTFMEDPNQRKDATVRFGTGEIHGEFIEDRMCLGPFGDACVPQMNFIATDTESEQPFIQCAFDGIMGLGFADLSMGQGFNLVDALREAHSLPSNQFSVYLTDEGSSAGDVKSSDAMIEASAVSAKTGTNLSAVSTKAAKSASKSSVKADSKAVVAKSSAAATAAAKSGSKFGNWQSEITFGGYKTEQALTEPLWAPVNRPSYWQIAINDIAFDNVPKGLCEDCQVAVDTGTSLLAGPSEVIEKLGEQLNLKDDCSNFHDLPLLGFVVGDKVLNLRPEDYVDKGVQDGESSVTCSLALMSLDVPPPKGPIFVFGDPFLRRFLTIYDRDQVSVGFAVARQEGSDEDEAKKLIGDVIKGESGRNSVNMSEISRGSGVGSMWGGASSDSSDSSISSSTSESASSDNSAYDVYDPSKTGSAGRSAGSLGGDSEEQAEDALKAIVSDWNHVGGFVQKSDGDADNININSADEKEATGEKEEKKDGKNPLSKKELAAYHAEMEAAKKEIEADKDKKEKEKEAEKLKEDRSKPVNPNAEKISVSLTEGTTKPMPRGESGFLQKGEKGAKKAWKHEERKQGKLLSISLNRVPKRV